MTSACMLRICQLIFMTCPHSRTHRLQSAVVQYDGKEGMSSTDLRHSERACSGVHHVQLKELPTTSRTAAIVRSPGKKPASSTAIDTYRRKSCMEYKSECRRETLDTICPLWAREALMKRRSARTRKLPNIHEE
jgi:hypothetical protein